MAHAQSFSWPKAKVHALDDGNYKCIAPFALPIGADQFIVTWQRGDKELTRHLAAVKVDQGPGDIVDAFGGARDLNTRCQEARMAPNDNPRVFVFVTYKAADATVQAHVVTVKEDMNLELQAPVQLGDASNSEIEIARLENKVYVVTGVRLADDSGHSAVCTFKVSAENAIEGVNLHPLSAKEHSMSLIWSKSGNRIGLGTYSGLKVYEVAADGKLTEKNTVMPTGEGVPWEPDWFQGSCLPLPDGQAAFFYRYASDPNMVLFDLSKDSPEDASEHNPGFLGLYRVKDFEANYGMRRPCLWDKGGTLFILMPGCLRIDAFPLPCGAACAYTDAVKDLERAEKFETLDVLEGGFLCPAGDSFALFYSSMTDTPAQKRPLKYRFCVEPDEAETPTPTPPSSESTS